MVNNNIEAAAKDDELQIPTMKTHKYLFISQICIRFLAFAVTLAAAWIMLGSNQTIVAYGITVVAKYSYSPAFRFFVYANLITSGFSVLSMILVLVLGLKALNPRHYFYFFLHDLVLTTLLMAGCAAGSAIGYIGKYGNDHIGWVPICDQFLKFCDKLTVSVALSYLGVVFYLGLTILSTSISRQIPH